MADLLSNQPFCSNNERKAGDQSRYRTVSYGDIVSVLHYMFKIIFECVCGPILLLFFRIPSKM